MKQVLSPVRTAMLCLTWSFAAAAPAQDPPPPPDDTKLAQAAAHTCHEIIAAVYADSLKETVRMQQSVEQFLKSPGEVSLEAARRVWRESRRPYSQSEAFRFSGGPIDSEGGPEEQLNAWPLDEALIDTVPGSAVLSIIADVNTYPVLDENLLLRLNMKDGEKNISCGWHAVEFLLWGQDGSVDGPGRRPASDYTTAAHAARRGEYLRSACTSLIRQFTPVVEEWREVPGGTNYRHKADAEEPDNALRTVVKGMVMLSGFELANERILVACETRAQEEEQSCFSDNTGEDLIYNIQGMHNLWHGSYRRTDGSTVQGPSLKDLTAAREPDLARDISRLLDEAAGKAKALPRFDQAILEDFDGPGQTALRGLSKTLEQLSAQLKQFAVRMGRPFTAEELEG